MYDILDTWRTCAHDTPSFAPRNCTDLLYRQMPRFDKSTVFDDGCHVNLIVTFTFYGGNLNEGLQVLIGNLAHLRRFKSRVRLTVAYLSSSSSGNDENRGCGLELV